MKALLFQLDGKLPNIALMKIAAHHRGRGDEVEFRRVEDGELTKDKLCLVERNWFDDHDVVYASAIFDKSMPLVRRLRRHYPTAIVGGSGVSEDAKLSDAGIETLDQDYSLYPGFRQSIGFSQRGCRFKCWFCKVPRMEGKVAKVQGVTSLWRGDPWPREIVLLDNDFFGLKDWRTEIESIRAGRFRVNFNQGINARVLSDEASAAIASVDYRSVDMKTRRLHTAWDNIGDEVKLFRGLESLAKYGVKPDHITVYMLIGGGESAEDREHRRKRLREFGARPYPMPYVRNRELVGFQRWIVGAYDKRISWADWEAAHFEPRRLG